MGLTLTIENEARLPDGGPLSFTLPRNRSADIGRDAHLDWTLPDPTRFISGKHCELTWRDGGCWLTDVSTNGTFLNGSDRRVQSPHRLRANDRLTIGQYIVVVHIAEDVDAPSWASPAEAAEEGEDLWGGSPDAAPPIDPHELRPQSHNRPVGTDFLEWAVDVPGAAEAGFVLKPVDPSPAGSAQAGAWDAEDHSPPPPEASPTRPRPVRPVSGQSIWVGAGPEGPWRGDVAEPPAPPPEPRRPVAPPPPPPVARAHPPADRERPAADVMARFAQGAGLPPDALAASDPGTFAEGMGRLMALVVDDVRQLLQARSQTKLALRSANHTMVAALDNNPLKFAPGTPEALRHMLGPRTGAYLDAEEALRQGFSDLKAHQLRTFSAMQRAVDRLLAELDPAAVEADAGKDQGFVDRLGSRRGRLWARYEALWTARSRREGGMGGLFMQYFAEFYDQPVEQRDEGARSGRFR